MTQPDIPERPVRPPFWFRLAGILLMLPLGIIIAILLIVFILPGGNYVPGEFLAVAVVIFLVLFVIRMLFGRSRRKYMQQFRRDHGPGRILRERYARGEITKEEFDRIRKDLEEGKR